MNHLDEEQLVLLYYGETDETPAWREHLAGCPQCREALHKLDRVLDTVGRAMTVPETPPDYGTIVFRRVTARIDESRARPFPSRWLSLVQPRRWAVAAAVLVLISAAYVIGRFGAPKTEVASKTTPAQSQSRERVLLVAVGDHLERTQMMLLELANAPAGSKGKVDISYEQQSAEDLLESNRLFRQTAARSGETGVANVLDELERVLLDVSHGPSSLTAEQWSDLRKRIEDQGLLFKVRVIGEQVRQREQSPAPPREKGTKL